MAQLRRKRHSSAVELLNQRSRGIRDAGTIVRHNLKIFRGLLLVDHKTFSRIWLKSSKSKMMFENGMIYSDNYLKCFSCVHYMPHILYKLPRRATAEKFEDALVCQSPLDAVLPSPSDHKPSLLLLTANNWLLRVSAKTGEELQRVYLSSNIKFKYLAWNNPQESFVVKSIQNKGAPSEQACISQDTAIRLAVFKVFPLQVVGVLDITKKVFGNGITDVVLSQDVLVVSHSNKSVRLYSFELIVQQYLTELTLGKQSSLFRGQTVGDVPLGIPVNIQLSDCPPVLLEVSCLENSLQLGGYPWHYIYTPPQKEHRGTHHICSVKDGTLATNGVQEKCICPHDLDEIFFHPDDSGRIIHVRPTVINVLKIVSDLNDSLSSTIAEDFSMEIKRRLESPGKVRISSRGRAVKTRFPDLHILNPEVFNMIEYEDELDILAVVVTSGGDSDGAEAKVHLVDNQSGKLLRIFPLVERWDDSYQHHVYLDKDTLVHVEEKNSCYRCHVYKLVDSVQVTQKKFSGT